MKLTSRRARSPLAHEPLDAPFGRCPDCGARLRSTVEERANGSRYRACARCPYTRKVNR